MSDEIYLDACGRPCWKGAEDGRVVNRSTRSFDDYLVKFNPELVIPKGDP